MQEDTKWYRKFLNLLKLEITLKPKKIFKVLMIVVGALLALLLLLALFIFQPLDHEPYEGKSYYNKMRHYLDSLPKIDKKPSDLQVGWAKISIIPTEHIPIASYGIRKDFKNVHDSIWCRAFVFKVGQEQYAFITLDLLIFPPAVLSQIKSHLSTIGIKEDNLFLTASHTHNGPGGWAEGLGGRILAGPYNQKYVDELTHAVITAITSAKSNLINASIGFAKYPAKEVLYTRISKDSNDFDYWLRVIKIKKENGQTAAIASYAGHPNILSSKIDDISGDYAGALVDSLEASSKIDFAAFAAGAVATHACSFDTITNFKLISKVASYLSKPILKQWNDISLSDSIDAASLKVPVYLRGPQLKVSPKWKIRPWVFNSLFGKQDVYVEALKLGDIVMVGTPCDFAGDLVDDVISGSNVNQHIMITSFNGGYVGYILPDTYYDMDVREPRDMDWYGPGSGSYFTMIIQSILKKL